ncbi:hypothetical protein M9Y10_017901 [Tritrichomonas musculus]|uniref:RRM domain-containing protein n=1 Tax=Tritrichomonas musculus TaxID=1915356 RepID=A0ABR2HVP8_9EUKA
MISPSRLSLELCMDSNWSDFLATPPNLDSPSNPTVPDFSIDTLLQAPSNYVLSSSQYSNIFQPPQQSPQQNMSCCCCGYQSNQQPPNMPKSPSQPSNLSCDISDPNLKTTSNISSNDNYNTNSYHNNSKSSYNRNVYVPGNDNGNKNYRNSDGQSNYESTNGDLGFNQNPNEQPSPPPSPNSNVNINSNKNTNMNTYQTNFNEIENRTLYISNLNPQLSLDEIKQIFDPNNNSKNIDISNLKINNSITIEYFDLRQAQAIKKNLNGTTMNSPSSYGLGPISVVYAPLKKIPDPRRPPNNGTIVVFHLPAGVTESHIESSFGSFGSIREIRGTPQKPGQRFIEFWDTRAAEAALNALNGKYVMGSKVSIEFSLPGGFRRNIQPYNTMTGRDSQSKTNVFNNCGSFKQGNGATSNHNFGQNSAFVTPSNMQNKF